MEIGMNMIPMVMKYIMNLQMVIGMNMNMMLMVKKSIMKIQRVKSGITDQKMLFYL